MQVEIPYRQGHKTIQLPDATSTVVLEPNHVDAQNAATLIQDALDNPLNSPSLEDFLEGADDIVCLVNDGTRPTPTGAVLEVIAPLLEGRNVWFMVATGAHRGPTDDEIRMILGPTYHRFRDRILVHDARQSETVFLGTSQRGTEMHINKRALDADRLLIIGSVEPHYFAGYTGGRKSLLPGVAGYSTIEQNHKFAMRPEAKALALAGNPVHDDMVDAIATLDSDTIFSIQAVLDRERRIYGVKAGHIHDSFDACIPLAHEVFCVTIERPFDLVIAVAPYPMDIDLYQSQKAIENGKLAIRDGGILLMVSSCRDGIGPDTFYKLLTSSDDPNETLRTIEAGYKLGFHKAAKLIELATRVQLWGVTELDPAILREAYIAPKDDVQTAIDEALQILGPDATVAILPEGSMTVPTFG